MQGRLAGKIAIVLGASQAGNMGQAIAKRFADEGAKVVVAGRTQAELERFASQIDGAWRVCDITSRSDLGELVDFTTDRFGGLDIAVNCVGWALFKPFLETTAAELQQMIDLQFKGPFQFFQAALGAMRDGGSAIQIGSISSECLFPDHAAYMGTKAGMDHVVRSLANDFGSRNIRVNTISPGLTETPMTADIKAIPGFVDLFLKHYPLGRHGTTQDVAATAAWLASDECFMTGQTLRVEGGMSLRGFPVPEDVHALLDAAGSSSEL
jgi:NAD(P)-dependent dehydrogenase (short-subunit alcohol dehydrogenase family)